MRHAKKYLLLAGALSIVGGSQAIFASSSDSNGQWNYGTLDNPVYAAVIQIPSFLWNWNYGTLDMPVWFSFGSSEGNNSGINVGIITNTSRSENSSSSLQKEEIIENASNPIYSPDGKSFAYVEKIDDKQMVVKDGVVGSKYTYVSNLTYSPDGKSFAYIAQQDNKMFVVKDGVEGSKDYVILSKLTYSPDSRHFAYTQKQFDSHPHLSDGKEYVVADGVVGIGHDEIINLTYSPDSQNLIYEVYHQQLMTHGLMKDGVEFVQEAQNLTYSPDGKSFAYVVKPGALSVTTMSNGTTAMGYSNKDTRNFIVKDGVTQKKYDSVYSPTYSPDGKSFAYIAQQDNKMFVVKDGVESQKYDYISQLTYSADSKKLGYVAKMDNKYVFLIDGSESLSLNDYTAIDNVYAFGTQGFVYTVKTSTKEHYVIDGEGSGFGLTFGPEGYISNFTLSPDGRDFLYVTLIGGETYFVQHIDKQMKYSGYSNIANLKYSPDSKGFSYTAKVGEKTMIVKQNF